MLSSKEPVSTAVPTPAPAVSMLRKIRPMVRLPSEPELSQIPAEDVRMLRQLLESPVECVIDPSYDDPAIEQEHLRFFASHHDALYITLASGTPEVGQPLDDAALANDDSGVDLLGATRIPAWEDERQMFLRFNFARLKVMQIVRANRGKRLTVEQTRELARWERFVCEIRSEVVRANLPLVLAMSKRTRITGVDFADLISEGNLALLRSVDKFDSSRGFKFSTYACRAILKSFSRVAARTARYRGYFPTEFDPTLEKSDYVEQKRTGFEGECVAELKHILARNLAKLNDVEERVIRARFALDDIDALDPRAKTLEQVGEMIGVTKERVRQIQNKALQKLKSALEDNLLSS
ncbi:MAG: sigma-70 family RNA polymerase sigma factor [Planctomycetia bacterium]|nr:MAG: sigma-70 family RNA polymerase sigma factor [Planctomycetia bacterium]